MGRNTAAVSQSMQVPPMMKTYTRFNAPKPNGKHCQLEQKTLTKNTRGSSVWRYSTSDHIPVQKEDIQLKTLDALSIG